MPKLFEDADAATVALASLTKMVGLLSAELIVGVHRDDVQIVEACIRAKLFAAVSGISPQSTAAGVALAHRLVEPLLRDLRARAEALNAAPAVAGQPAPRAQALMH